jgi:hypothetical protein
MKHVVAKAKEANGGADTIMVCERGASFGYNNLVSDMRSLAIMRETGVRSSLMRRIPFSCRVGRARFPAGSASSCRSWRAQRLQRVSPGCSWKPILVRKRRFPMAPTVGRSIAWSVFLRHWLPLIGWSKGDGFEELR